MITIPTIGFTPFDRVRRCGFSVAKYGEQKAHDKYDADCGNGVRPDGSHVVGTSPLDMAALYAVAFQVAAVQSMCRPGGSGRAHARVRESCMHAVDGSIYSSI